MFVFIQLILSSYVLLFIKLLLLLLLYRHHTYFRSVSIGAFNLFLASYCLFLLFFHIYIYHTYHRLRYEVYLFQAFRVAGNRA